MRYRKGFYSFYDLIMAKQKALTTLSDLGGLVFSTHPIPNTAPEPEEDPGIPPAQQNLRIWLERGKGGKESTVIKGFIGTQDALEDMAKWLKNKCAAGGNAKDGIVLVQGDHRDKILKLLVEKGYKNTKKAGA